MKLNYTELTHPCQSMIIGSLKLLLHALIACGASYCGVWCSSISCRKLDSSASMSCFNSLPQAKA